MTTFKAIEFLIENKSIDYATAASAAFQALQYNKIDEDEYNELIMHAIYDIRELKEQLHAV